MKKCKGGTKASFNWGAKLRLRNGPRCFEQLVKGGTDSLKTGNVRADGLVKGLNEGMKVPGEHKEKQEQEWCSRHPDHELRAGNLRNMEREELLRSGEGARMLKEPRRC